MTSYFFSRSFEDSYNFEKEAKRLQKSFKKHHETFTTNVESISLNKVQATSKIEFNFINWHSKRPLKQLYSRKL